MTIRALPSQERLRQLFDYNSFSGELFCRPRPDSDFRSRKAFGVWKAMNPPGRRVGRIYQSGNIQYWVLCLTDGMVFRSHILQHRLIWKLVTGTEPFVVDHRNTDGLDNSWKNLREATRAQNRVNTIGIRNKASGLPRGVWRSGQLFRAQIMVGGEKHWLGSFETSDGASEAYQAAAKLFHGEFYCPPE